MTLIIGLYGNRMIDLDDLKPSDIDVYDIAHSLSNNLRFNGHSRIPYSVAEHSVALSYVVPPILAFPALMHDATEAYLGDIIAPVKSAFPAIGELEKRIAKVICEAFQIDPIHMESVKPWDIEMCKAEARQIMGDPEWARESHWPEFVLPTIIAKTTEERRRQFIERYLCLRIGYPKEA